MQDIPYMQRVCGVCGLKGADVQKYVEINYSVERKRWECAYCFFRKRA